MFMRRSKRLVFSLIGFGLVCVSISALIFYGAVSIRVPEDPLTHRLSPSSVASPLSEKFQLYPHPTVDFAVFDSYPRAKKVDKTQRSSINPFWSLYFETEDRPEVVESLYQQLATKNGWKYIGEWEGHIPHYVYGTYGQSVYSYDLSFGASGAHGYVLLTHGWLEIERSLPIYIGASEVTEAKLDGTDVGLRMAQFTTTDKPDKVLAFYKKLMADEGWKLYPGRDQNSVQFWLDGDAASREDSIYERVLLAVEAKLEGMGKTSVKLDETSGLMLPSP